MYEQRTKAVENDLKKKCVRDKNGHGNMIQLAGETFILQNQKGHDV